MLKNTTQCTKASKIFGVILLTIYIEICKSHKDDIIILLTLIIVKLTKG